MFMVRNDLPLPGWNEVMMMTLEVLSLPVMNSTVSVLGEVANPGRFNIDKDRLTLLAALSKMCIRDSPYSIDCLL